MADEQGDDLRARAASHVDRQHWHQHEALIHHHRQEDQAFLRHIKRQLHSFDDHRVEAIERHRQAIKRLDGQQEREAAALDRQQSRIGSRLRAMTRKGRLAQAGARQQLTDRFDNLRMKEHRNLEAAKERQHQAKQEERISQARHLKLFRAANSVERLNHQRDHEQKRPWKIDQHIQALTRAADQEKKHQLEMRRDFDRAHGGHTLKR